MGSSRWGTAAFAFVAGAFALAAPSQAASVLYEFTSGQASITVTTGATTLTPVPVILSLNGIFAEFNEVGPVLVDFEFTTTPDQAILLSAPYGGYDQIVVNSASLIPGANYTHYGASNNGGGEYSVSVAPVHVDAVYSAAFSAGPPPPPANNIALSYDNAAPLLATINVIEETFTLEGVTIGVIYLPPEAGEPQPLVVKADLTFQGMVPIPTPEPGMLVLVGLGLGALAALRSRGI